MTTYHYLRAPAEIYRLSFAIIAAEANLDGLPEDLHQVAIRMIHACGMTDLPNHLAAAAGVGAAARAALQAGAPILVDAHMVARGITAARLPANNEVICTLTQAGVPEAAAAAATTRSAAAVDRWVPYLAGAVVAIGNAPTALFRLLELLEEGAPRPAAILGMPVGFVGAAESKVALAESELQVPWLTVHGRRGGSALASAAVNALASDAL